VNGIEKNRLVSPHGATHLKRRPRRRTPGTECIFFRIPGKRNAADRAERGRKKGNPLKAFRAETAGLLGNQQLGTGKTAGRKEKINNTLKKRVQDDYIPSLRLFNSVASSGISIRGTSAQRRSRS